jgi:hypothetical protein
MRTPEELAPIVERVASNPILMQKFLEVRGSDDKVRASAVIDEITRFAQSLDPSVTHSEGTRITVMLMQLVGHPRDGLGSA